MAVNVVDVAPAGTVAEPGTGNDVLLLDNNISVPPAGAAMFNVTVQVVGAPDVKVAGLQTTLETESTCPKAIPQSKKSGIAARRLSLKALIIGLSKNPINDPVVNDRL
ncbi:MAG TPA: hypothetical protein VH640_20265 [Bryobacteraceae bacterium]